MKNSLRRLIIFICLSFVISFPTISNAYSYWDILEDNKDETITIGDWDFDLYGIGPSFASQISNYFDTILSSDPNNDIKYILSQTDAPSNLVVTLQDLDIFGYTWDIWSKAKTSNYPTMGYPVLIDRSLDEFNNPVHDINPEYSPIPLYDSYNYFTAYDAMNTLTNNLYSLRLNYNTRMTTNSAIGQVTNISFYAMLGLSDPDDLAIMRDTQKILVEVSANGSNWTKIGTPTPTQVSSTNEAFTYYSFDVPGSLLGQNLWVRIRYNGRALKVNNVPAYGRLIIDDLQISVN